MHGKKNVNHTKDGSVGKDKLVSDPKTSPSSLGQREFRVKPKLVISPIAKLKESLGNNSVVLPQAINGAKENKGLFGGTFEKGSV